MSTSRILAIVSTKGGSGKTTMAINLAVAAAHDGVGTIGMLDLDPQGTVAKTWFNLRPESHDNPVPVTDVTASNAAAFFAGVRKTGNPSLIVIDTPPAQDNVAALDLAVSSADLVLIPTAASTFDLAAIGLAMGAARKAGKPFAFIVNHVSSRARETAEAVAALSAHGVVAPVLIGRRQTFITASGEGLGAIEWDRKSKAADEIRDLWGWVKASLGSTNTHDMAR